MGTRNQIGKKMLKMQEILLINKNNMDNLMKFNALNQKFEVLDNQNKEVLSKKRIRSGLGPQSYYWRKPLVFREMNSMVNEKIHKHYFRLQETYCKLKYMVDKRYKNHNNLKLSYNNDWTKQETDKSLLKISKVLDDFSL